MGIKAWILDGGLLTILSLPYGRKEEYQALREDKLATQVVRKIDCSCRVISVGPFPSQIGLLELLPSLLAYSLPQKTSHMLRKKFN